MKENTGKRLKFGIIMLCLLVTSVWTVESSIPIPSRDNYADLGNRNDEQYHDLSGWGDIRGEELEGAKDPTSRYLLLRDLNSVDLFVPQAGIPYNLTTRTLDGGCDDSFKIYVNDKGPLYTYYATPGDGNSYPFHEVEIDATYITSTTVKVTFENIATDDCGLAAVYFVELEEDRPPPPPHSHSIYLHVDETDVEVGGKISLILSAVNSEKDQVMTVQLTLKVPSGMSVTGGSGSGGGGLYTDRYVIKPGEEKHIPIDIETNQEGNFNISGEIYCYLENEPIPEYKTEELTVVVRAKQQVVPNEEVPSELAIGPPEKEGEEGGVCGPTLLLLLAAIPMGVYSLSRRRR